MIWYAVVSDKIETIYAGDGELCDLRRNIVGFEDFQHIPIPEGLNIHMILWNGSEIVEDVDKTQANLHEEWNSFRRERNNRLAICDWTQFRDSPLTQEKQDEWAAYRQALRDLPTTVTDPTDVTWPTSPTQ